MKPFDDEDLASHSVTRTNDAELAQETLGSVAHAQVRLEPGGDGRVDLWMRAVSVGELTISLVRFGAAVVLRTSAANAYHVAIPLRGASAGSSGAVGFRVGGTQAVVLGPRMDSEIRWAAGSSQVGLTIPAHRVTAVLGRYLGEPPPRPVRFQPGIDMTHPDIAQWLGGLALINTGLGSDVLRHPVLAQNMDDLFVGGLLLVQPHSYTAAVVRERRPIRSPKTVGHAIELMQAHPEYPWTSVSLAAAVHLSTRALQQVFADSVGTSPMRYLRHVRLDRTHDQLRECQPAETTVAEVASRWGFTHHGRFAAAYRDRFGEPPAMTLRLHTPTR